MLELNVCSAFAIGKCVMNEGPKTRPRRLEASERKHGGWKAARTNKSNFLVVTGFRVQVRAAGMLLDTLTCSFLIRG